MTHMRLISRKPPNMILKSLKATHNARSCQEWENNGILEMWKSKTVKIQLLWEHNKFPVKKLSSPIECVRLTSSNSQIQNRRATKGFILIRHKRYQIYTCLQLSSSIASFVWKPAHFELRSYDGAWHNTKIAFVEKYTLVSWFLAILGV